MERLSIISTLALFIFDCILMFPREVKLIWNRKIGLGGVLYFMTRFTLGLFLFITLCASLSIFSVKFVPRHRQMYDVSFMTTEHAHLL
ncbi:hypothetical protein K439DRAFT_488420 [Ramaria rubella]|nr:hypothetical protein K439DRAFT_488420 [Ramaria rubella]